LNPNTPQNNTFCAPLQKAAGLAFYIFPAQPGTTG
jgi:hypothetical protein